MLRVWLSLHLTSDFSQNFETQFKTPSNPGSSIPRWASKNWGKWIPVTTPGQVVQIQLQGISSARGEADLHHLQSLHCLFSCPAGSTETGLALPSPHSARVSSELTQTPGDFPQAHTAQGILPRSTFPWLLQRGQRCFKQAAFLKSLVINDIKLQTVKAGM